jgi:hypothetical protein
VTTQPEAKISKAIMDALRKRGIFCFKVHGSAEQMSGIPDILACVEGRFVGLETKMPAKRKNTSARQELVMAQINQSGGIAVVVCGVDEAIGITEEIQALAKGNRGLLSIQVNGLLYALSNEIKLREPRGEHNPRTAKHVRQQGEINGLQLARDLIRKYKTTWNE